MLNEWRLAKRFLQRDWSAGELHVLLWALIIAVSAVSSVNFFTDRIYQALNQQANVLLGADLVVNGDRPFSSIYQQQAKKNNLQQVQVQQFPSMLMAGEQAQLASIKAVTKGFPLRGDMEISEQLFAPASIAKNIPESGSVWLEPRLMTSLQLKVGDSIQLGFLKLKVSAVIAAEPGRSGDLFSLAPTLMMNLNDLAATRLIQAGSRVRYQLLLAGPLKAIENYRQDLTERDDRGVFFQGIQDARPEIRTALQRAGQFLGLAALITVILAGVAVALAARRYARRHLDHCAIMRCLGSSQARITKVYALQMSLLGLIASVIGCVLGFFAHWVFVFLLGNLLEVNLPAPGVMPVLFGLFTGMITLLGFALPPLLQLKSVPALRVLRRDIGNIKTPGLISYSLGIVALGLLMIFQARDINLGVLMVLGTLVLLLLIALLAWIMVMLVGRLQKHAKGAVRLGLSNIPRHQQTSIIQIVAFSIGLASLFLLGVMRSDLLDEWQNNLPDDAPNRFLINIKPQQVDSLRDFFQQQSVSIPDIYPMVRGRLVAINEQAVNPKDYADERAQRLATREFNMSWASDLPSHNRLSAGQWWRSDELEQPYLSVEDGIAKTLGLKLGDVLTYDIAGENYNATITNFRKVEWDSFRANFFVIATSQTLNAYPAAYMTSFYLPKDQYETLNQLVAQFPNVTIIDVAVIMDNVRNIISRVSMAVEAVFVFTLLAGLIVLYAGIQATHDERMLENAMVRTLGAQKKQIRTALISEFLVLGLIAGMIAAVSASLQAFMIAERVLHMDYYVNVWVLLLAPLIGAVGVAIAGLLGNRSVVQRPPLQTIRSLQ